VSGSGGHAAPTGSFEYDPSQPGTDFGVVNNWTTAADTFSQHGYNILFKVGTATSVQPLNRFSGSGQNQDLWALPTNDVAMNVGNNFMALDGADGVRGALQQTINGLTIGQSYTLTFDFAAGQLKDRDGETFEHLLVSLGSQSQVTGTDDDPSHGAVDWQKETMIFTATGTSEVLSFLSIGTPSGDPPMALLDNVSLTNTVPEPATWGLMLVGVAAVGASLRMRRRAIATLA
jgi:hypothetical protein